MSRVYDFQTVKDVRVKGEVVLVRVDLNEPAESYVKVRASVPTIEYLRAEGAQKIVLMSHLGRPEGREKALSLRPVAEKLAEVLSGVPVAFVDEISGPEVEAAVAELPEGGVLLLENLRFDAREKADAEEFAEEIVDSVGATLFVQDGFGVTHRAHASTDAITKLLPAVAGLLVEKEVAGLSKVLEDVRRPFVAVIGGAKEKVPMVERFAKLADKVLVGGKLAVDAPEIANEKVLVAEDFDTDASGAKLDIGPVATGKFVEEIAQAETVLWNGVLGKVEDAAFATGSEIVAKYLGEHPEITSVICGGDTAGFVQKLMEENPELQYTLVSTGGGAALEFLAGEEMPGLAALMTKGA